MSRVEGVSPCAEGLSSACALFVGMFRELSVYLHVLNVCCLHVPRCWHVSRAERVSPCAERMPSRELSVSLHVSRAERVSSFSFLRLALAPLELSVSVHLSAHFEGWVLVFIWFAASREESVCACVRTYQEPSVYLRVFSLFESLACCSMCLHTLRAESVAACV